ncbi:uncharacterized protein LOC144954182, partial [Lampetra fluviatilis]
AEPPSLYEEVDDSGRHGDQDHAYEEVRYRGNEPQQQPGRHGDDDDAAAPAAEPEYEEARYPDDEQQQQPVTVETSSSSPVTMEMRSSSSSKGSLQLPSTTIKRRVTMRSRLTRAKRSPTSRWWTRAGGGAPAAACTDSSPQTTWSCSSSQ